MNIDVLREFTMLCRVSSLNEAASLMHVSQPTLSRHLESLERHLGVKLVERSPFGVTLTNEGAQFLEDALEIVNLYDRAVDRVRSSMRNKVKLVVGGSLRIQSADHVLSSAMGAVKRQNPGLSISPYTPHYSSSMSELAAKGGLEKLESEEIDLAILPKSKRLDGMDCTIVHLYDEPFDVFVPADSPLAEQKGLKLSDFRHMTLLFSQIYKDLTHAVLAAFAKEDAVPRYRLRIAESYAQYALAEPDCAIPCCSSSINRIPPTPLSGLARTDLDDPNAYVEMVAVFLNCGNVDAKREMARLLANAGKEMESTTN